MQEKTLQGKTLYGFGDSLVEGHELMIGMLDYVAQANGMVYSKYARNGARVVPQHRAGAAPDVAKQIEEASPDVPDFICFNGLTNDAWEDNVMERIGTLTEQYEGPFDTGTFIGAFERVCALLRQKYQDSSILYICPHKMPGRPLPVQDTLQYWARTICEKWAIPYLDMYRRGGINTCIPGMCRKYSYDTAAHPQDGNGTHLNALGYQRWYAPAVTAALRDLLG